MQCLQRFYYVMGKALSGEVSCFFCFFFAQMATILHIIVLSCDIVLTKDIL